MGRGRGTSESASALMAQVEACLGDTLSVPDRERLGAFIDDVARTHQRRETAYRALLRTVLESGGIDPSQLSDVAAWLQPGVATSELEALARRVAGTPSTGAADASPSTPPPGVAAAGDAADADGRPERIHGELRVQAVDTGHRSRRAAEMLERLICRLELASELPELMRVDETLIDEVRDIAAVQELAANRIEQMVAFLDGVTSRTERLDSELRRMRTLSLTDENTGLPNRRALLRQLKAEIARAQRYGEPLCLVLLDLDDFKAINDRFGHAAGDVVLRHYAGEVLARFRQQDVVARYGGEEFAVLLPGAQLKDAAGAMVAARARQHRVAHLTVEGEQVPVPTFSAGVVDYGAGDTAEALINRADRLLYRAKHRGRDRIETGIREADAAQAGTEGNNPRLNRQ